MAAFVVRVFPIGIDPYAGEYLGDADLETLIVRARRTARVLLAAGECRACLLEVATLCEKCGGRGGWGARDGRRLRCKACHGAGETPVHVEHVFGVDPDVAASAAADALQAIAC